MGYFEVKADTGKNRLYMIMRGEFEEDELKAIAGIAIAEVNDLKEGFDVIYDLKELNRNLKGIEQIERVKRYLYRQNVGRFVHMVDKDHMLMMEDNGYQWVKGKSLFARNMKEAEGLLV
jgi:hypothetical protein